MSINTTARTWVADEVVSAAMLNAEVRDLSRGLQGVWDTWVPTWGGMTLGNGSYTARYMRVGKTVTGRIVFTAGSTSSFSGSLTFTLPVPIRTDYVAGVETIGPAQFVDNGSGASRTVGGCYVSSAGSSVCGLLVDRLGGTYATSAVVSSTTPWTWATADTFAASFQYEAA